jgi:WD40 repeat protein
MCLFGIKWKRDSFTIASGSADKSMKIWNRQTGEQLETLLGNTDCVKCLIQMNWTKDDTTIVSGSLDKTIRVWNIEK